jgi:excisionase family DNA binding protein
MSFYGESSGANRLQAIPPRHQRSTSIGATTIIAEQVNHELLNDYPDILTVPQTARALQVSQNTVRRLLMTGAIKGRHVGQQWRIPRAWLVQFINEGGR